MKWTKCSIVLFKGREAESQLLNLQQGGQPVSQYAVTFWVLAVESGWTDSALRVAFLKGLSDEVKDDLAIQDDPPSWNQLVHLAIRPVRVSLWVLHRAHAEKPKRS